VRLVSPNYFGVLTASKRRERKKLVFGLPGNPVSALVSLRKLIEPAIWKLQGIAEWNAPVVEAELVRDTPRDKHRLEFLRVRAEWKRGKYIATPATGQESHMLGGIAWANALITIPAGLEPIKAGSTVEVEFL